MVTEGSFAARAGAAFANIRRDPKMLRSVVDKVASKASALRHRDETEELRRWCAEQATDVTAFIAEFAPQLADEVDAFHQRAVAATEERMPAAGFAVTSGANVRLLHFLTRWLEPEVVVETGVAGGTSSWTILEALRVNGHGTLHSSDLPYLFKADAHRSVGAMVPEELRDGWDLRFGTDTTNLPRILAEVGHVDLFHYDSDKSYWGRERARKAIEPVLGARSVVVYDDVEENAHFRDLVAGRDAASWRIFAEPTKFVGVLLPRSLLD